MVLKDHWLWTTSVPQMRANKGPHYKQWGFTCATEVTVVEKCNLLLTVYFPSFSLPVSPLYLTFPTFLSFSLISFFLYHFHDASLFLLPQNMYVSVSFSHRVIIIPRGPKLIRLYSAQNFSPCTCTRSKIGKGRGKRNLFTPQTVQSKLG